MITLFPLLAACGTGSSPLPTQDPTGASARANPTDTLPPSPNEELTLPGPELVPVSAPREFRGLWVATVANLDWPSRKGLSAAGMRRELDSLVDGAHRLGFNALVFQVRPEGDALYDSELEPWSRFLTGKQGRDPGLDPLEYLIRQAHEKNIEVHAWFNPYRAASARTAPTDDAHVSRWAKRHTRSWGPVLWLDPGAPEIREHALAVISDVVTRYDVDGIHLDDYFYPYPDGKRAFPDDETYASYRKGGGALGRAEWRRSNVDTLVEEISSLVADKRPDCRFGISPFGIYRPGQPAGIRGLDQVAVLNADPLVWYEHGWIDYLAPQLYWTTRKQGQEYGKLLRWWDGRVVPERPLLVGLDITKVGRDREWTIDEMRTQVRLAREAEHTMGQIWFRATPILHNTSGLADLVRSLYDTPALPPPTARIASVPVEPPRLVSGAGGIAVEYPDRDALRGLVLYAAEGDKLRPERLLPPSTTQLELDDGAWVLSAVVRGAVESPGVRLVVGDADGITQP